MLDPPLLYVKTIRECSLCVSSRIECNISLPQILGVLSRLEKGSYDRVYCALGRKHSKSTLQVENTRNYEDLVLGLKVRGFCTHFFAVKTGAMY